VKYKKQTYSHDNLNKTTKFSTILGLYNIGCFS
jgi:hypothetical protein